MIRPGKLRKAFGVDRDAVPNMFQISSPLGGWLYDDQIMSVTIRRGSGSPVGVATNTATVQARGVQGPISATTSKTQIALTEDARKWIADRCGVGPLGVDNLSMAPRFTGRVASASTTDTGDRTPGRWSTSWECVDLVALMQALGQGAQINYNNSTLIQDLYRDMFTRSSVKFPSSLVLKGSTWLHVAWDISHPDQDPNPKVMDVGQVFSHFIEDLGYYLRTRRDGVPEVLSTDYRKDYADNVSIYQDHPITRSVVNASASWKQATTIPYGVGWNTQKNGGVTWYSSEDPDYGKYPKEQLEFPDIYESWDALLPAMHARVYRNARAGFALESATIDLVAILNHPSFSRRALLANLLLLEVGDMVTVGNDWPAEVRDVMCVTQITETIAGSGWTLTLDLCPSRWASGDWSTLPRGTTWDTAYPRETPWNAVPDSTTWETAP